MSIRARAFIGTVLAVGVIMLFASLSSLNQISSSFFVFLVLTVLATASQLYEAEAPDRKSYYPHFVFFFAGILLLPSFLFLFLIAIPHLLEWLKKRIEKSELLKDWYIQPFNISTHLIAGYFSSRVYYTLDNNWGLTRTSAVIVVVAFVALTYVLINHMLIGLALFFARGISIKASKVLALESLLPDIIMASMGYILAVLWSLDPWLIVPALSPLILMYQALQLPQLKQEAQTDVKTGLLNARQLNKVFKEELDRAIRFKRPLSFIMADLDMMRDINNNYGHLAGDTVLSGIAKVIRENLREFDSAGRFGGEEFAIVLPEVEEHEALILAERIRAMIEATLFSVTSSPTPIRATMSLGVSCYPEDGTTATTLTETADRALYLAKRNGRNRIEAASSLAVEAAKGEVPADADGEKAKGAQPGHSPLNVQAAFQSHKTADETHGDIYKSKAELRVVPIQEAGIEAEFSEYQERLQFQALHDALTGLPNRALFMDRLSYALSRLNHSLYPVGILYLDLDRFKIINDSLGHEVGDRLITAVSSLIRSCVRQEDTVARVGGDEFMILLENLKDGNEPVVLAERLFTILKTPLMLENQEIFVTTSIGIVLANEGGTQAADVMRHLDVALYQAKSKGKDRFEIFDPSMNARALEQLKLEGELRRALERSEFEVFYHPKVLLASGRIEGMEALVRWRHPQRGLVMPGEFIALAEETGLICPIGWWVLEEACRQAYLWQTTGSRHANLVMNVNLSARQFQQDDLIERVSSILKKTRVDPGLIQLEITESMLMEQTEETIVTLHQLKDLGLGIAIDDFGIGYSSLSYLKRFPVDSLKIDRSFVSSLGKDADNQAIVQAVLDLGRALKLRVIAEGVETIEELNLLKELGCELGQGFYFARPLPRDEAEKLLQVGLPSAKLYRISPSHTHRDFRVVI